MEPEAHLAELARTIQLAVAPVFLLMALGTILGVLSTRLGRIVDRSRVLSAKLPELGGDAATPLLEELAVLGRRRRIVNHAITSATVAALLVCLVIAIVFVGFMLHADFARAMAGLFIAAMGAFILCLLLFLREILVAVSTK
jgi:hypothetical protein